jgi:hypothetical protein
MHYPEMWGFVQFSDLTAGTGRAQYTEKPAEAAKWALRQIYYAQHGFQSVYGRFAENFAELGLKRPALNGFTFSNDFEASDFMFEACCMATADSVTRTIMQDGRIRTYMPEK